MRLIGILGGTSWPSTVLPYRLLNEDVQRRLGGHHSARIVLYSIDYHPIRGCYVRDWSAVAPLLLGEIRQLLRFRPDCWMIANNTLHKAYGEIAGELRDAPPLLHAIELVREELLARGMRNVLLLGTRFTMEDGYYARPLEAAGIRVTIPEKPDREMIGALQMRLADGQTDQAWRDWFADLLARHRDCDAVVLGCTELPLAIDQAMTDMAVIDPLVLQCRACVDYALG